jgi:hypothetical protein
MREDYKDDDDAKFSRMGYYHCTTIITLFYGLSWQQCGVDNRYNLNPVAAIRLLVVHRR